MNVFQLPTVKRTSKDGQNIPARIVSITYGKANNEIAINAEKSGYKGFNYLR